MPLPLPLRLPLPLPDALRLTCVLSVVSTAGVTSGNVDVDAALPAADVVEETVERCKIGKQWVNTLGHKFKNPKRRRAAEEQAQKMKNYANASGKCARKINFIDLHYETKEERKQKRKVNTICQYARSTSYGQGCQSAENALK